jgi:hypothetical protein
VSTSKPSLCSTEVVPDVRFAPAGHLFGCRAPVLTGRRRRFRALRRSCRGLTAPTRVTFDQFIDIHRQCSHATLVIAPRCRYRGANPGRSGCRYTSSMVSALSCLSEAESGAFAPSAHLEPVDDCRAHARALHRRRVILGSEQILRGPPWPAMVRPIGYEKSWSVQ